MTRRDTLVHQLAAWAERRPGVAALHGRRAGVWKTWTWKSYWQDVRKFAKGLLVLGLSPGDRVAIVGKNRPEWVIGQLGVVAAGGIPVPLYTTATVDQAAYIVEQSGATMALAGDDEQTAKLLAIRARLPALKHVVVVDTNEPTRDGTLTFEALLQKGAAESDERVDQRIASLKPEDTALLIYTSGTTGFPKGAELTQRGLVGIGEAVLSEFPSLNQPEVGLSYLPLCHIAEQIFTNLVPLATGGETYFCEEMKEVREYLLEVRPTIFLGVPRVWEKMEAALSARFDGATGVKAALLAWARKVELESFKREVASDRPVGGLARKLARRLVIGKVKRALGFDRLKIAATGAAPISLSTLEFFASLGIVVHEAYGMTETTGVATLSRPHRPVFGYVGQTLPGVEIKIAPDGEILFKGPTMVKGYYDKPDETRELFDEEGWLRTGDLGRLDGRLLKITGRKKDLLITAGGKNVAPAEVEHHLSGIPGVGQVVLVGDRKPYLSLLVALDPEGLGALAAAAGAPLGTLAELSVHPKVHAFLEQWIETHANAKLARYQSVKRFFVLPEPLTVEGGELTPSLKVKRNVVVAKYAAEIERLYAEQAHAASS